MIRPLSGLPITKTTTMTISKRLIFLIALALTSSLLIAILAWQQLNSASDSLQVIAEKNVPAIHTLNQISLSFKERRIQLYQHIMRDSASDKQKHESNISQLNKDIDDSLAKFKTFKSGTPSVDELTAALAAYTPVFNEVLKRSQASQSEEAEAYVQQYGTPAGIRVNTALKALTDENTAEINASREAFNTMQQQAKLTFVSIVLVSCILLLSLGTYIYIQIRNPLRQTVDTMQKIAKELNLSLRIPLSSHDEIGQMVLNTNQVLEQIQTTFQHLKNNSHEVNQSAADLAQMAGQQAANAEIASETAAAMAATVEEVSSSISHIATRSQETRTLSETAHIQAEQGIAVIDSTVEQIYGIAAQVDEASRELNELQERNKEIQSMVQIIKEIADQTSLLALNAAIEAARAGEEGRGFAVVADEVRKLAERTTRSTQQIVDSVSHIHQGANRAVERMMDVVDRVNQGVAMVGDAGKAMHEIRATSENVVGQVSDISLAIQEQSTASHAMALQVERTATMAEEAHAAASNEADSARQLHQLAETMQDEVKRYRLS